MKTVDVGVPCYRYGHFLRECVQSILTQHGVTVRVLILDDASPDNTPEVGTALAREDSRVTYRRHTENRGHIATYNEALDWAEADYVMILSADDMLTAGAFVRALWLMEGNPQVGACFGQPIVTSDPSSEKYQAPAQGRCQIVEPLAWLEGFCKQGTNLAGAGMTTGVMRTSVQKRCGHYRPELPHSADMEMWLRLAIFGPIGIVHSKQAYYRQHDKAMHHHYSDPQDFSQRKAAFDFFFREFGHHLPEGGRLRRMASDTLRTEAMSRAAGAFLSSQTDVGRVWLRLARESDPQNFAATSQAYHQLAQACDELIREG